MKIRLDIERLVLHGVELAPADRQPLTLALHAELDRLLRAAQPPHARPGRRPEARGAAAAGRPAELGRLIAQTLHRELTQLPRAEPRSAVPPALRPPTPHPPHTGANPAASAAAAPRGHPTP